MAAPATLTQEEEAVRAATIGADATAHPSTTAHEGTTAHPSTAAHQGTTAHPSTTAHQGTTAHPSTTAHQGTTAHPSTPSGQRRPALSPSRINDFKQCPLLFRFRSIDRLPEPASSAATRGTLVHAVLERLFDLPAANRTPESAHGLLGPQWDDLCAREPAVAELFAEEEETSAWLRGASALLDTYFTLEDPRRLQPAERELLCEVELSSGVLLRGIVDRIDVARDGALRIVDYKTGRSPSEQFVGAALFQMRFYALVLWRLRGVVPRRLQLIYLGDGQVLTYDPDEDSLRATERTVEAVWAAIQQATRRAAFRPKPSRLCSWCSHQALCPEFGGTPPPWPAEGAQRLLATVGGGAVAGQN